MEGSTLWSPDAQGLPNLMDPISILFEHEGQRMSLRSRVIGRNEIWDYLDVPRFPSGGVASGMAVLGFTVTIVWADGLAARECPAVVHDVLEPLAIWEISYVGTPRTLERRQEIRKPCVLRGRFSLLVGQATASLPLVTRDVTLQAVQFSTTYALNRGTPIGMELHDDLGRQLQGGMVVTDVRVATESQGRKIYRVVGHWLPGTQPADWEIFVASYGE